MEMKTSTAGVLVQYGWYGTVREPKSTKHTRRRRNKKKKFIPRLIKVHIPLKVESQKCD